MNITKYIGIPYKRGGRTVEQDQGLDCYGLVREFYKNELGISLEEYRLIDSDGQHLCNTDKQLQDISDVFTEMEEVEPMDILLFNICGQPLHMAIALDSMKMLHAIQGAQSSVERYKDNHKWDRRFKAPYRHKDFLKGE